MRPYLQAGLVDSVHLAMAPVLMGQGENLLRDLDLHQLGFRVSECVPSENATHLVLTK